MKQYLLLFKSGDFTKTYDALTGNPLWTSSAVNLYSNSQYNNYSYTRSRYGLNLIGDNTYVGTEVTSPSYSNDMSTPLSPNALYVTNAGEVVYEPATPDLIRFLDTSSRIDILAYKHTFTNLPGFEVPSFNIQMHESDTEDGPWLKSSLSFDSNIIFIRNAKPWIKIELEIFSENIDVSTLGLLFYLEIGIHEPTSPVISNSARNILRRFPTWTKLFDDSLEPATPSLAVPQSTGGKFLTALVQENIDAIVSEIDLRDINAYINSADENMLAWAYVSYDIPTNLQTIVGDDVILSPVNSLSDFHRSKITDHVYYYNPMDKQILVMREYVTLSINGTPYEQYAVNIFNNFDEFGARVGLERLYKETNFRYKQRILDVSKNIPGIHSDGLKRTLRRELDIWKAYGIDVNSNDVEAMPYILEMSDLEKTTPYFSPSGKPEKMFKDLVEDLNNRYPSNIGYVKWGEGTWDYSGMDGEGVSRIPAIYDTDTSPLLEYYQPGIGDFSDGRFILESLEKSTISFNGSMSIAGVHKTGIEYAYTPILVDYSWYVNYLRTVQDYDAGRQKVDTVSYTIGDIGPGGGKIFITPSTVGNSTGKYFETAPVATEVSITWATGSNQSIAVSGADGTAIGTGAQNTIDIVAQSGNVAATSAAVYCSELDFGGYSDWFMPSLGELRELHSSKNIIGDFDNFTYWSSSEVDAATAWTKVFFPSEHPDDGLEQSDSTKDGGPKVRPIRSFISTETYIVENESIGVGLTYEIVMPPHDNYATPSTFYSNLNYSNRDDFYVGNRFPATSSASPEFNYIRIFDQEGNTIPDIVFKDKVYNQIYLNTHASPITNNINFYDASSVKITFSNGGWNYISQTYDTSLATASYWASFSTNSPSFYTNPVANSHTSMTTPNRQPQDANIKIGSTNYSTKIVSLNTSPLQSTVVLNSQNDPTVSGISTESIYINEMLDRVILPFDATPQYLYVDVSAPNGVGYFGSEDIERNIIGGRTTNPDDNSQYLIPSSPNILWQPFNSSNASIGASDYFDSATISYASAPHYMLIESATSSYYPIYFNTYESFTAEATPNLFSGYIDSLDNVYETGEDPLNSYFNADSFLSKIYLSKDSFGLLQDDVYIIKDATLNTAQDSVLAYVESQDALLNNLNSSFSQDIETSVDVHAKKDKISSALHTGWIYLDENDYYIYANPVTESSSGRFFNVNLSNTPRNGAPVLVKVDGQDYRNIAFEDAATPGKLTFQNSEVVNASANEIIYLAYKDVMDVSILDNYTGKEILDTILVNENEITLINEDTPESAATPFVYDREYLVTYKVNNAWYLDNDVYDPIADAYNSVIYFSSTPNSNSSYNITYENSINDITYPINLQLNSSLNPIDEGYIYISKEDYPFSHVEAHLSPAYISDSTSDLMYLSLVSHDNQHNLKPGQTFAISGDLISATPSFITTSDNGLATSIIRYNGDIPAVYREGVIDIIGIGSATPNGGENSSSEGYSLKVPFEINRNDPFNLSVKAAASDININADGISKISISGKIYWKNKPFNNEVQLSWNVGRTLKDLFAATPDHVINTNSNGEFTISNEITASDSSTPGYWFARVNISNEEAIASILTSSGEVPLSNDVTISGDVVYWYE
jgi:hypothetical protein